MGIEVDSGRPAVSPVPPEDLAAWVLSTHGGARQPWAARIARDTTEKFGLADGVDPKALHKCGWGVVWAANTDEAVKDALLPLLNRRRTEATPAMFREITLRTQPDGSPEPAHLFLERHQVSPGIVDPEKLPYYLLLVGGPEEIPFEFQYALATDYAVGRICLPDAAAYARYAQGVRDAEVRPVARKKLGLFGPAHHGDAATTGSSSQLLTPLEIEFNAHAVWTAESAIGAPAIKARLLQFISGPQAVPLLFSASHGAEFRAGDARMVTQQGSILCQDWDGPGFGVKSSHVVSAADVASMGDLQHQVWFAFACFGAATPAEDNFPGNPNLMDVRRIAPSPFMAALPTALLGHDAGPALGFIGHVERAWSTSFTFGTATHQFRDFAECLRRIINGHRLGHAVKVFGDRHASLAAMLAMEMIRALREGQPLNRERSWLLVRLWTAAMDARNFVLFGDPAARRSYQ